MNDHHVNRLTTLKEELAQIDTGSFPENPWPRIESWIAKATPVIRSDWPQVFEDFQKLITKPSEGAIVRVTNDALNLQLKRKEWERSKNHVEDMKQKILSFLDGLFTLVLSTENNTAFEEISLLPVQKELLSVIVEAARNIPRDKRRPFFISSYQQQGDILQNSSLPNFEREVYMGDIEQLARKGLIHLSYPDSGRTPNLDVAPEGFAYYEWMKQSVDQPIQGIETEIKDYLDADHFQQRYPIGYQKWTDAVSILWDSDSEHQLTTIGHLCREAMQEFATTLVENFSPPEVDKDKTRSTVAQIRAVLEQQANQLGQTERPFLDALLAYWGTVSDLVQRQEHGGQKEGEPLVWEDGRRVVFQTAIVMFEIDRALSR